MAEVTDVTNLIESANDKIDYTYSQIEKHIMNMEEVDSEQIRILDYVESMLVKLGKGGSNHQNYQYDNILDLIQLARIRIPKSDFVYECIRHHRAETAISAIISMLLLCHLTNQQCKESIAAILNLVEKAHGCIQINDTGGIDTATSRKYLDEAEDLLKNL